MTDDCDSGVYCIPEWCVQRGVKGECHGELNITCIDCGTSYGPATQVSEDDLKRLENDKRLLDYLVGEKQHDHSRALFRRNVPITRGAISAAMHGYPQKPEKKRVLPGSIHRHYKNGEEYVVESVPIDPNTQTRFVTYRLIGSARWEQNYVRPLMEFQEKFTESDSDRDTRSPASFA